MLVQKTAINDKKIKTKTKKKKKYFKSSDDLKKNIKKIKIDTIKIRNIKIWYLTIKASQSFKNL